MTWRRLQECQFFQGIFKATAHCPPTKPCKTNVRILSHGYNLSPTSVLYFSNGMVLSFPVTCFNWSSAEAWRSTFATFPCFTRRLPTLRQSKAAWISFGGKKSSNGAMGGYQRWRFLELTGQTSESASDVMKQICQSLSLYLCLEQLMDQCANKDANQTNIKRQPIDKPI